MQVHLDTDLGGDPDDACALAMLLGWPDVEITGITTNLEVGGQRAGCVRHCLGLAGRLDIPVAAGSGSSLTTLDSAPPTWGDDRYWPGLVPTLPSPPGATLDLLAASIERGATVIAIGAWTNLALLQITRPGSLDGARVVAMGGWVDDLPPGFPAWEPGRDFNVRCDVRAAEIVLASAADLTLVTLATAVQAQLRERHLPRLRGAGPLGELLATQSEVYAADNDRLSLAALHPGLADDLVNFHWDPVTCAIAVGWSAGDLRREELEPRREGGALRLVRSSGGRPTTVAGPVDGTAFAERWIEAVEEAARLHG